MKLSKAIPLIKIGKLFRRAEWTDDIHVGLDERGKFYRIGNIGSGSVTINWDISFDDILADDWKEYNDESQNT